MHGRQRYGEQGGIPNVIEARDRSRKIIYRNQIKLTALRKLRNISIQQDYGNTGREKLRW
jgi:hypothetical protein